MKTRNVLFLLALPMIVLGETGESTVASSSADEITPTRVVRADPDDEIEEIVVEGERVEFSYDMENPKIWARLRDDNGKGAMLYDQRRYEEAFPYLLNAARAGFKLSQARLSYLYQQGLGVAADATAAIGWIGVAADQTTQIGILNYYNRFLENVPEENMGQVLAIVEDYRTRYGSQTVGLFCSNTRMAGTHISRLKCDFKDEHATRFRDGLDIESIVSGIEGTGSFTMGDEN